MVNKTPKTAKDFEDLSDEDFLKLDEANFSGNAPAHATSLTDETLNAEETEHEENTDDGNENVDSSVTSVDGTVSDESDDDDDSDASINKEDPEAEAQGGTGIDPMAEAASSKNDPAKAEVSDSKQPKPDAAKEEKAAVAEADKPVKGGNFKLPEGVTEEQATTALSFYSKITAPFKADGKDFEVRSAEDAIRLMQQGVNYSRRMQEIKPMKVLNRMLQDHQLDNPDKVSFLIDVAKGNKEAITKLLKDHNLDPMDLDVSSEVGYQAKSYAGSTQDHDFRDALDNLRTTPDGQALISEIHGNWDDASKVRLREQPQILGNILELKQSGIYSQVANEVAYQRSMGYLTHVPFLDAFDQVGLAMKNAGVLKIGNVVQPAPKAEMGNLQEQNSPAPQPQNQPLVSGARKAPSQKKDLPNPHLSSTPPSKQSSSNMQDGPDFGKMSDEDFLKLPPPE